MFSALKLPKSEKIACWNEKPTTRIETEKKRSYNHQNRDLGVLGAIWA